MKKTIRMNERELHRLISESVKRVLMEGKVVNNKPYFRKSDGSYYKPGDVVSKDDYDKMSFDMDDENLKKRR